MAHAGRDDAHQDLVVRRFRELNDLDGELPLGLPNDGGARLHSHSSCWCYGWSLA